MTQKPRTLLIVDDDVIARRALARTLADPGFDILQADGPEQAFALLEAHEIKVVISDHHMVGALGTTFLAEVEQRFPKTTRILLTSDTSTNVFLQAINTGNARRVMYKPWVDEQLRAVVRQSMGLPRIATPRIYELKPLSSGTLSRIKAILGVEVAE